MRSMAGCTKIYKTEILDKIQIFPISKENKVIWRVLLTYFKNANLPTDFVTIYFIDVLNEKDKEVDHQSDGKVNSPNPVIGTGQRV
jgi:hypothetical protein